MHFKLQASWRVGEGEVPRLCMDSDTLCQALMSPYAALAVTTWANISLYHS